MPPEPQHGSIIFRLLIQFQAAVFAFRLLARVAKTAEYKGFLRLWVCRESLFAWLDFSVGEVARRVSTAAVMVFAHPLTVIL